MSNYIQDAFLRITAMLQEAFNTELGYNVDVRLWPHQQETKPYFTLRLGPMQQDITTYDEWIEGYNHTILIRLVTAHLTQGQIDEPEDNNHHYIVLVEDYFRKHPMLTTDSGTYEDDGGPNYLLYAGNQYQAEIVSHTGIVIFLNTGLANQQVGCEFTLRLPYLRDALP